MRPNLIIPLNRRGWLGSVLIALTLLAGALAVSAGIALAQTADTTETTPADTTAAADAYATDAPIPDTTLSDKQTEVDRVKAEIASINANAEQAVERYNVASTELEMTNQQLAENEQTLQQASARLQGARNRLGKRLENIYKDGSLGLISVMLDTSSFNDFLTRFDMLGKISEQDRSDIDDVIHYRSEIEQVQIELENAQHHQEELSQTLATEKSAIEGQLSARESVLAGVESEVAQLAAEQLQAEQEAQWSATAEPVTEAGPVEAQTTPTTSEEETDAVTDATAEDPGSDPLPPSSYGDVVSIAEQYLGVPYVWGGASPSGFDCSGLVMYVYAQVGVSLPHSAAAQYYSGTRVRYDQLQRGDLVFFGHPISHVGIFMGGGMMIHAPTEGEVVSTTTVGGGGNYAGACRI